VDPAIIGTMRIGYFRIGVAKPIYDEAIEQLMSPPSDPAVEGRERERVLVPIFDEAVKQLESV
jgi:hypothetical protein